MKTKQALVKWSAATNVEYFTDMEATYINGNIKDAREMYFDLPYEERQKAQHFFKHNSIERVINFFDNL